MDGLAIQSNAASVGNVHSVARQKASVSTVPRKVLANIQNTLHSKSVTFENVVQKPGKSKLDKGQTPGHKKINILADKAKTTTPGIKPVSRNKVGPKPFKIYNDETTSNGPKEIKKQRKKIEEPIEKEYMPPCTDKEFEIPMPEYLQEVLNHQPTYNIDTTKHIKEIDYEKLTQDAITAALNQKLPVPDDEMDDADVAEYILDSLSTSVEKVDEEELIYQLEHDESFSIEALSREIRAAKLDLPDWL